MSSIYEQNLNRLDANHVSQSPLSWIARAADIYPNNIAVIHGKREFTWSETFERCRKLAHALSKRGISKGDTVSIVATNIPSFYESLFGVAATGAVINPINIRLDAEAIAFILAHGESKVIFVDTEFSGVVKQAIDKLETKPIEEESVTVFMLLSAASGFAALSILLIMLREFRGSETTLDSEE